MGWVAGYGWGGVVAWFFVYFVFLPTFEKNPKMATRACLDAEGELLARSKTKG